MPLAPGTRLGPYEVVSPIGKGGMGEVYRARDTKLEREVAIKVLPEQSANDEERLARFEREAKLLASLNHPNIASIYGFEEGAGVTALVLELVEGPTLAQRIARGPIPVEEAIAIAKQIAEALEAGHEAGVIHRDLKPANIKVKEDGTVKVLDYGLAKALEGDAVDGADSELSQSPTLTRQGTQIGVILGTTPYMSPEQAKGKRVDKRSDIFSFGVVLYEMLTGEKAFAGDDVPEILASIINREPEWSKLPSDLDPRLPGLVRRCLRKDPKKRVRDIGDVRNELEDIEAEPSHRSAQSPHPRPSGRDWLTWTSFAVAAGLAVTLAIVLFGGVGSVPAPPASGSRQQFAVHPPDGVRFTVGETPALSPDGRYLAFVATDTAGQTLLWIRSLDSLEPRAVPRTEGATFPFWSPDSQFIGFFADGQLKKIEVAGGPPQIVAPAADSRGGAWSSTGEVLFSPRLDTSLYRVPAQGGRVEPATSLDPSRQEASHRLPSFLPDGRRFLFVIQSGDPDNSGLYMGSLDSGEVDRIGNIESKAIFTSSGHLLYTRERTLMAQRFDPERKALVGDPAMLVENVAAGTSIYGERAFSASSDGKLAHWNEGSPWSQPAWFDRHGEELESAGPPGLYDSMSLSPDGTKAAYERWDPHESSMTLWVHDFARGVSSPFSLSYDWGPTWSPDGKTIAYGSLRHGSSDIYGKGYSMGQEERLLFGSDDFVGPMDWSADGRYLVFINYSRFDIGLLPVDPPGDPRLLLDSEFVEKDARLSPDGRWMAFTSNESGAWEVWIQSFPDLQNKLQVSNAGGSHPEWDPDSNELYYISRDRRLMSVAIEGGSKVQLGSPRALFPSRIVGHEFKRLFAVARNGEKFLMIVARETENSAPITLTLNWTAGLKP